MNNLTSKIVHSRTLSLPFSLYLDVIRFLAAIIVLLGHSSQSHFTGGLFWQFKLYGQTAVMVFFVLSGFVIAYVTHTREDSWRQFLVARLSRLYSIILPAILLSFICTYLANKYATPGYEGLLDTNEGSGLNYLLSLVMLQNAWEYRFEPPNNGPFWSITFEVTYYTIFALLFFLRNTIQKILFIILVSVIVGPTVIFLMPVWFLGYLAYLIYCKEIKIPKPLALFIWFATVIALYYSATYREYLNFELPFHNRRNSILGDYLDGILFFINIVITPSALFTIKAILIKFSTLIRYISSLTFAIYLFHMPLLRLISAISPFNNDPSSAINLAFLFGLLFPTVWGLGHLFESQKSKFKKILSYLIIPNKDSA